MLSHRLDRNEKVTNKEVCVDTTVLLLGSLFPFCVYKETNIFDAERKFEAFHVGPDKDRMWYNARDPAYVTAIISFDSTTANRSPSCCWSLQQSRPDSGTFFSLLFFPFFFSKFSNIAQDTLTWVFQWSVGGGNQKTTGERERRLTLPAARR